MKSLIAICLGLALISGTVHAPAQVVETPAVAAAADHDPAGDDAAEVRVLEPENTLERCSDGIDNDGDGFTDCDDQDCWIFAMCIPHMVRAGAVVAPPPHYVAMSPPTPGPERGHQCWDGIDNNNDGLTDCFEPSCQRTRHCRREMYYVPEPDDKAPGVLVSVGLGMALPNYRRPSYEADVGDWRAIPFDPDVGVMASLDIGYLPLPWFGIGAQFVVAGTGASNRTTFDYRDDLFKYDGFKLLGHAGGFLRFQYPIDRFVPRIDVAGGYTWARFRWDVFDGRERWSAIDDHMTWGDEGHYLSYGVDSHIHTTRHFTLALAPGADFFVRKRSVAINVKLWLPVFAIPDSESSTDNVGLLFGVTYMPMWRERPVLKPEYEEALARQREAAASPVPEHPAAAPGRVEIEPMAWEPEDGPSAAPVPDP